MKRILGKAVVWSAALLVLAVGARAQVNVEITAFGGYNLNLGFPQTITLSSQLATESSGWYTEWQNFINHPMLEQAGGAAFGGRLAVQITPMIGIEASFEYGAVQFRYNVADIAALQNKMEAVGWGPYFTFVTSGGHMMRIYGNVVLNFPVPGGFTPYITGGIGTTSFTLYPSGPSVSMSRSAWDSSDDWHYVDTSALTFNAGGGFKYLFGPMVGIRVDARVFLGSPKFDQYVASKEFGDWYIGPGTGSAQPGGSTQSGSHTDVVLNAGIFIRL